MNIFKILASNDGSINEPNVSSFLAYLLDPNENHGLESVFLEYFLSPIIFSDKEAFKELIIQNRVRDLSKRSPYEINVQAEITVVLESDGGKAKTRDIDILIEIYNRNEPNRPRFSFCIENKIKDGAINKGSHQLYEEICGLTNYYLNQYETASATALSAQFPTISLVFVTPKRTKRAVDEFLELEQKLVGDRRKLPSFHMTWGLDEYKEEGNDHVIAMLNRTLQEEAAGNIEPIYDYTKHTLKSFLTFIKSDFQSYKEEKSAITERKDYGRTIPEYYGDVYEKLDFDVDYSAADIKKMVGQLVLETSGKEIRKNTLDGQLIVSIVNNRNRRHYSVIDPQKDEINLFYYPDEKDRKVIRKFNRNEPPAGVMIYWKDSGSEHGLGQILATDIYPKS